MVQTTQPCSIQIPQLQASHSSLSAMLACHKLLPPLLSSNRALSMCPACSHQYTFHAGHKCHSSFFLLSSINMNNLTVYLTTFECIFSMWKLCNGVPGVQHPPGHSISHINKPEILVLQQLYSHARKPYMCIVDRREITLQS